MRVLLIICLANCYCVPAYLYTCRLFMELFRDCIAASQVQT